MEPQNTSSGNVFSSNLYERLGVTPYATPGEIEQQWRKRLRKLHPDAGGNNETAALLNEAKNILSNPKLRAVYDKEGLDGVTRLVKQARTAAPKAAKTKAIANIPPDPAGELAVPTSQSKPPLRLLHVALIVGLVALIAGGAGVGIAWYIFLAANSRPFAVKPATPPHPAPAQGAGTLVIVDATWGTADKRIPVTEVLRNNVKDGHLDVTVNTNLLTDPTPYAEKNLEITYEYRGKRTTTTIKEGQKLAIGIAPTIAVDPNPPKPPAQNTTPPVRPVPVPAKPAPPDWSERIANVRKTQPTGIIVLKAEVGRSGAFTDVTDICQTLVTGDSLTVPVNGELLRKARFQESNLDITYMVGEEIKSASLRDGDTLQVGPERTSFIRNGQGLQNLQQSIAELQKKHHTTMVVLDANFGADASWKDVTDICQECVIGDSMTIPVVNDAFRFNGGYSPTLTILYFDGKELKTEKLTNGNTLQVGPQRTTFLRNGQGLKNLPQTIADLQKKFRTSMVVLDANYGATIYWKDVTDLCQNCISDDSLTVHVSNEAFQFSVSNGPTLTILYYDGKEVKTERLGDGSTLQVGKKITSVVRKGKGAVVVDTTVADMRKYPTGLLILQASWGNDHPDRTDVTDLCQAAVDGDSLSIPVGGDAFNLAGENWASLDIQYFDGKEVQSTNMKDGGVLQVGPRLTTFIKPGGGLGRIAQAHAELSKKFGDGLVILQARYGNGGRYEDVRELLQKKIVADSLSVRVGENWPDPWPGADKSVELTYWDGTQAKAASMRDGGQLKIEALLPSEFKNLLPLPAFIPAGKPFTHNFGVAGSYAPTTSPKGALLNNRGILTWTPTETQVGTQQFDFTITVNGKNYVQSQKTEVVTSAIAAAVGGDLKKLQSFMHLDLAGEEHSYQSNFDRKDALVLQKDQLLVIDSDGITVKATLKLAKPYIRIAERDTYFVAIHNNPLAMDLLDKKTGKPTKTIKLDYNNFHDLALLPGKPISFVTASIAPTVPHDRIVVINEETGDVREPKDLMGTFMQIDHSGQHMWVGLKDIYRTGTEYHIDPNFNVYDIPTYGDIDYLLRYDLVNGALVLKEHLNSVGANGSGIQLSPDGKRVTYLSFTGFPLYSKNIAAWSGLDLEKKPVVYTIKDLTGGQGSQHLEFHPVLPIVLIAKDDGVLIFGKDSGDEEPDHIKIAPGALDGITVRNAHFSPDGLSIILDCQQGEKFFLYKVPLLATDTEKALIKKGLPAIPAEKPADTPPPPGVERG